MQRFIFWATESVECNLILDGVLLRVLFYMMMKNFRNGGFWTRDIKVKMQRFIFCATESVDFFLHFGWDFIDTFDLYGEKLYRLWDLNSGLQD